MKKLLREPLLHFLLLGAGLFVVHGWLAESGTYATDSIVINRGQLEHLAAGFARIHQRPPTRYELDGLINGTIREEIFYREALAQGLDRDDVIVRRRLMQKLEFMVQDIDPVAEPTEPQLREYLQRHPDKFLIEPSYSFRQVYLNPQRHGDDLQAAASGLLAQLQRLDPDEASTRGDSLLLEHRFDSIDADGVRGLFGPGFATALETLPAGIWNGPVASGYGVHLVLLERRDAGRQAPLREVSEQVAREWKYEQQQAANARFYADLRRRYDITIEGQESTGPSQALAAELRP